ncbi:MAG: low molecular weight protein-tyrosine-phosphatase [Thiobacillus sp.]|jgi:protein-tyrosine phosphatase|uniref:low molecular weight protein-tyrosine-phosphatase n=1 Tax=Thiobacillus sp. TaxID=924 RepID=UPI0028938382|nr:low molecular weight protein-tyrosine-phosphatase [Thiobacillus sp.]MDT3708483.1 low molecular weight protein-tyrosine-phosphatase [Thiobacillus sp.]
MISRVLVVCIGNICRSPMAEGLLRQVLPGVQTSSAGLAAMLGHGADPNAVRVMADAGIDITAHRARMLTDAVARDADLILVMDDKQKQRVAKEYPYTRGRVFRLAESAKRDIPDPYRQSPEMFDAVFALVQTGVDDWVKRINSIG